MSLFNEAALKAMVREAVREALAAPDAPHQVVPPARALTDPELAAAVGYSLSWVRQARAKKLIRQVKVGSRYITPADEVARLLREGCPSVGDGKRRLKAQPKNAAA